MAAQITLLLIYSVGLLLAANQHGKPKEGKYNFWVSLIAYVIIFYILYWGGFFDVFFK